MDASMFRKLHDSGATAPALTLTIDGQTVSAEPGDSIAAVLLRLDPPFSRTTPVSGSPRTPYCMMGVCFECLASVDGVASTQTCLVQVREGMRVERQHGRRALVMAVPEDTAVSDVGDVDHRDGMPGGVAP
jgi:predicted molibdopterin-dependent oxidoreductase YjgC